MLCNVVHRNVVRRRSMSIHCFRLSQDAVMCTTCTGPTSRCKRCRLTGRMLSALQDPLPELDEWRIYQVMGKGDAKFKKEWCMETRNYMHHAGAHAHGLICRRCWAGRPDRSFLDVWELRFNAPEEVAEASACCHLALCQNLLSCMSELLSC